MKSIGSGGMYERTNFNSRMFACDANKQACIADICASTCQELVAAAESCQLAIIHPGKPAIRTSRTSRNC